MEIQFSITIEPFIVLSLICGIIILYVIKRGYDWERQQMVAKKEQGQLI